MNSLYSALYDILGHLTEEHFAEVPTEELRTAMLEVMRLLETLGE